MIAAAAATVVAVVVLPHALPQARLTPGSGVALWLAVLALRALLALSLATVFVLYLPTTALFALVTQWCFHAVVPFIATHLGFSGHGLGDVAVLVPALVLALSSFSAAFGIWRGARAVRSWLGKNALGPGPRESLIVAGPEVVVATAGLRAPRVVVSAGALARLDEAELEAGLEHEWGHVARRHRFIAVLAQLLFGISRLLPGTRQALARLQFHLERDADEYAVRRTGDRLALAGAICKAAEGAGRVAPALAHLGGPGVAERVRLLACDERRENERLTTAMAYSLATAATALALFLALSAPALAETGIDQLVHGGTQGTLGCGA